MGKNQNVEALVLAVLVAALPSPSPTPATARSAIHVSGGGSITVIDQSASGPGTQLPLYLGSPDDPQTPYEFSSGTPGFTGTGAQAQLHLNFRYDAKRLRYETANPFVDSRTELLLSYLGATSSVGMSRASLPTVCHSAI